MKKAIGIMVFAIVLLSSCGGGTQYRDPNKDKGSGTWGPYEIKRTTKKMVDSLYKYLKSTKKEALLQVKRIRNRTSEHISTKLLSNQITTNLIQKRISFLDDEMDASAIKQMKQGMTGMIDPDYSVPVGKLQSPNLYLYGEISENVRYVGGKKVQYLVVTLKLRELATRRLKWQDRKEFLKATSTDRVSF